MDIGDNFLEELRYWKEMKRSKPDFCHVSEDEYSELLLFLGCIDDNGTDGFYDGIEILVDDELEVGEIKFSTVNEEERKYKGIR